MPADVSIGLNAIWGLGGFLAIFAGQTTRLAPRRVTDMNGNTVVCQGVTGNDRVLPIFDRSAVMHANRTGAIVYNTAHSYMVPVALLTLG